MPIDSITIRAVRGIRDELALALKNKSLVVRGDNGTGKSSIVHALLWALRGERITTKTEDIASSWSHVLESPTLSRVHVRLKDGGTIEVSSSGVVTTGSGQEFRKACEKASPFLVRKQLLRLLEDKPVDRFRYLDSFLELEQADTALEAFASRAKTIGVDASVQREEGRRLLQNAARELPRDRCPPTLSWTALTDSLLSWASDLGFPSSGEGWSGLVARAPEIRSLVHGEGVARRRMALEGVLRALETFEATTGPDDPVAFARLVELERSAVDGMNATLLRDAAAFLEHRPHLTECPVCGKPTEHDALVADLRARLASIADECSLREALEQSAKSWLTYWHAFTAACAVAGRKDYPQELAAWAGHESWREVLRALQAGGPSRIRAWIEEEVGRLRGEANRELVALPSEENLDPLRSLLRSIDAACVAELAISLAVTEGERLERRAQLLQSIAEAFRKARQDVAREQLDEISVFASEFYGLVHPRNDPEDVTGAPSIAVQRRSKGTALLRGEFNQKAVDDPRLFYSDGHLDTVAICVFLALRRFRANRDGDKDPKLMVLDDIVLSVDLGHGGRLLDIIRDTFSDHQVLLLTHNGLFLDWCKQRLPPSHFAFKSIRRWTLEGGPQIDDQSTVHARLKEEILKQSDSKLLAQAIMNAMDDWLARARLTYSLPVPAKELEQYTLSEIWDPFVSKMKKIQKTLKADPVVFEAALLRLEKPLPRLRNSLAAHANEFALEFPLATVREIAGNVVQLVEALQCSDCAQLAGPVPKMGDVEILRCHCERIRHVRPTKQTAEGAA